MSNPKRVYLCASCGKSLRSRKGLNGTACQRCTSGTLIADKPDAAELERETAAYNQWRKEQEERGL